MKELKSLFLVLALTCVQVLHAQVHVAHLPDSDGPHLNDRYEVRVRPAAGLIWQSVPVLRCDVNTRRVQQAAYSEFDMGEPVVVQVVRHEDAALSSSDIRIRPPSRGIPHPPTVVN